MGCATNPLITPRQTLRGGEFVVVVASVAKVVSIGCSEVVVSCLIVVILLDVVGSSVIVGLPEVLVSLVVLVISVEV